MPAALQLAPPIAPPQARAVACLLAKQRPDGRFEGEHLAAPGLGRLFEQTRALFGRAPHPSQLGARDQATSLCTALGLSAPYPWRPDWWRQRQLARLERRIRERGWRPHSLEQGLGWALELWLADGTTDELRLIMDHTRAFVCHDARGVYAVTQPRPGRDTGLAIQALCATRMDRTTRAALCAAYAWLAQRGALAEGADEVLAALARLRDTLGARVEPDWIEDLAAHALGAGPMNADVYRRAILPWRSLLVDAPRRLRKAARRAENAVSPSTHPSGFGEAITRHLGAGYRSSAFVGGAVQRLLATQLDSGGWPPQGRHLLDSLIYGVWALALAEVQ